MRIVSCLLILFAATGLCLAAAAETAVARPPFVQRELLASVRFEPGSSRLSRHARGELDASLERIRSRVCPSRFIRVEGFAEDEGNPERSLRLSLNRAYSVYRFLEVRGIPCMVGTNGYGNLRQNLPAGPDRLLVEIASYPKHQMLDLLNPPIVEEGKLR